MIWVMEIFAGMRWVGKTVGGRGCMAETVEMARWIEETEGVT
jgi:hypothetical protein